MDIEAWMQQATGGDSLRAIAKRIDVSPSTISRYLERNKGLSPEYVIKISRAYGIGAVDALVDTGHLMEHETELVGVSTALGYATNEQILEEMMRRVDPQAVRLFQGEEGAITPNFSNSVSQFPAPEVHEDWQSYAVADESPDHDEEDTDFD